MDDFHSGDLPSEPKPPLREYEIGSAGVGHVNYPHHPGYLYDCAGCEAECFCDADAISSLCIYCSLEFERTDYEVERDLLDREIEDAARDEC